jgi:hypothetical protein
MRRTWGREAWLSLGGATLVLFVVWIAWPSSDSAERAPSPTYSATHDAGGASDFVELRATLTKEIEARELLEYEVSLLRARLGMLDSETAGSEQAATSNGESDQADESPAQGPSPGGVFNSGSLLAHGIDPDDAASLRAVWEDVQMDKIHLSDQAVREGWHGTAQYQEELRALDADLREELSVEAYDGYLYATGKKNRTRVRDVIARSPGALAGFVIGDTILSYDGERIFNVEALRKLVGSGRRGETVRVEVWRGDSTAVVDVPRGPLGLMLVPHRQPPL